MGYYIQTGTNQDKAMEICRQFGGKIIPPPISWDEIPEGKALICVVDNGMFEAAAFAYDDREFKEFSNPKDFRPKTWVLMDLAKAKELTDFKR